MFIVRPLCIWDLPSTSIIYLLKGVSKLNKKGKKLSGNEKFRFFPLLLDATHQLTLMFHFIVVIMTSIQKLDVLCMSQVYKMRNSLIRKGLLSHLQFRSYVVLEELTSSKQVKKDHRKKPHCVTYFDRKKRKSSFASNASSFLLGISY